MPPAATSPVWLVNYGPRDTDHQALFVEHRAHPPTGTLLHVQTHPHAPSRGRMFMSFQPRRNYNPFASRCYAREGSTMLVARLVHHTADHLLHVCGSIIPPDVPAPHFPRRPNCRSWVENVLLRAHHTGVVVLEEGVQLPGSEIDLRLP